MKIQRKSRCPGDRVWECGTNALRNKIQLRMLVYTRLRLWCIKSSFSLLDGRSRDLFSSKIFPISEKSLSEYALEHGVEKYFLANWRSDGKSCWLRQKLRGSSSGFTNRFAYRLISSSLLMMGFTLGKLSRLDEMICLNSMSKLEWENE